MTGITLVGDIRKCIVQESLPGEGIAMDRAVSPQYDRPPRRTASGGVLMKMKLRVHIDRMAKELLLWSQRDSSGQTDCRGVTDR
jgi:hypothetical protein